MHNSPFRVLPGPWPELPPTWYCSVDGGNSAFSVFGQTRKEAVSKAAAAIYDEAFRDVDANDPFAMDTAEQQYGALLERLSMYTPQEWTQHCVAIYEAEKAAARGVAS